VRHGGAAVGAVDHLSRIRSRDTSISVKRHSSSSEAPLHQRRRAYGWCKFQRGPWSVSRFRQPVYMGARTASTTREHQKVDCAPPATGPAQASSGAGSQHVIDREAAAGDLGLTLGWNPEGALHISMPLSFPMALAPAEPLLKRRAHSRRQCNARNGYIGVARSSCRARHQRPMVRREASRSPYLARTSARAMSS
jgi:hypothetical protein